MISSRHLADLHPTVEKKAIAWLDDCKSHGMDILVTSTYRDIESQNSLYAQGRTKPGGRVTNAKGGQSYHNWRVALDFVPMVHGKPDWKDIAKFRAAAELAKKQGFEWAGDWKTFKEYAHIQFTGGLKISDFKAGRHI